jgi:hypothetical protein
MPSLSKRWFAMRSKPRTIARNAVRNATRIVAIASFAALNPGPVA